jgi:hypothetical protein
MKKDSQIEFPLQDIKKVSLPSIDVTDRVMNRIHSLNQKTGFTQRQHIFRQNRFRTSWVIASVLFLATAMSVGAAVLPIDWNGIKVSIFDDGGKNAGIDAVKEFIFGDRPTYKQLIENTLKDGKNLQKAMSLEKAQKEFPFTILRPSQTQYKPYSSIGAMMNISVQENGTERIIGTRPIFHDFYELKGHWIVVTQSLDAQATQFIQGKADDVNSTYIGKWESVKINGNVSAMFIKDRKENRLIVQFKTQENQAIELKLIGNATKEEMIKLSEAYILN